MADAPVVFAYIDLGACLADWFAHQKRTRRHFSFARVARDAGLGRSTFANILAGRRLPTEPTLEALGAAMGLDLEETAFLLLLRRIPAASTLAERSAALQEVFAHPRFHDARRFDRDVVEILSHWSFLAVYELSRSPGFREDPAWVAAQLDDGDTGRVGPEDMTRVLLLLERVGLLERGPDGVLRSGPTHATSKLQAGPSMPLQRSLLDLARERLLEVRQDERLYTGGAITVPRSMLPALRSKLWEHFLEWVALADAQDATEDDLLCMVQLQLYPVARASVPGTLGEE